MSSTNTPKIGDKRKITSPIPKMCCSGKLLPGDICTVWTIQSENRLLVSLLVDEKTLQFHKVKRSTFMANSEGVE